MNNLPILQSPYQRRLEEQMDKDREARAFFRMNETSFERKMQKVNQPTSVEVSYTISKKGKGEEIRSVVIKANEISGRWSMDPDKKYKSEDPEKDFFIQSNNRQWCLDLCTLGYLEYLRDEFMQWIIENSWPRFRFLKEAKEHHPWLSLVCELTVEEAIMMNTYSTWIEKGISNFIDPDMKLKMGDLMVRRGIVRDVCVAENRVLKTQGLGADTRRAIEDSIINDKSLTRSQKEKKLQKVINDRSAIIRDNWDIVSSARTDVVDQVNKDLHKVEKRWIQERQEQLKLEGSDNE